MIRVSINQAELNFLEMFRVALSAETNEDRLAAIRCVKHDVISVRLEELTSRAGPDWVRESVNRELVDWAAVTSATRSEAAFELAPVARRYEDLNERRLNVAEHAGKLINFSIHDGKFEGVQTQRGILYQVGKQGREFQIRGAKDKDTIRECWRTYRGVVHLGMAMDFCEELSMSLEDALMLAEEIRRKFSGACPKGTSEPYVSADEQISFVYESGIYGPRFRNRGLPFSVRD